MDTVTELIQRAIDHFGSESAAAKAAGVSQPTLNQAKRTGRIGPKTALGLDRATNGKISKHDLRPDLWDAPAPSPSEAAE